MIGISSREDTQADSGSSCVVRPFRALWIPIQMLGRHALKPLTVGGGSTKQHPKSLTLYWIGLNGLQNTDRNLLLGLCLIDMPGLLLLVLRSWEIIPKQHYTISKLSIILIIGNLIKFKQDFSEILSQALLCCHWRSLPGNSKIMHHGIACNITSSINLHFVILLLFISLLSLVECSQSTEREEKSNTGSEVY